jgi:hypothetical protein
MEADRAYRPHEAKNIWDGEPIGTGRKIWPEFSKEIHVREFKMEDVAPVANCFMAIDPAQHYYPACLWMAIFPKNNRKHWPEDFYKWIYAEWPTKDALGGSWFHDVRKKLLFSGTTADIAREILMKDGSIQYGIKIQKRGIDTRFAKGSGSGNFFSTETIGIVGDFAKKENGGIVFSMPDEKVIDVQKSNIKTDLQYNTLVEKTPYNEPALYVAPWCLNLIQSLSNHRLEEDSEKESEKYKDFSDTLRILYATIDKITWNNTKPQLAPEYVTYDEAHSWMS